MNTASKENYSDLLKETDSSYGRIINNIINKETSLPSLVKKFRKIIVSEINSAEIIKIINQFALLKEKDLENENIKNLFENLKISKIPSIKNIHLIKNVHKIKNIKKILTSKKKNIKFCSKYNSIRKLFILFLTKIDPTFNLFYTNYVNNLCTESPNEYLKEICLFYILRMNLDENTIRKIVEDELEKKNLNPSLISLYSFIELEEKVFSLENFYAMQNEEILNFNFNVKEMTLKKMKSLFSEENKNIKKIIESEFSYKFLEEKDPLFFSYYLQNENEFNLKIGVRKTTEFIMRNKKAHNNYAENISFKFLVLCLEEEEQSVKFEALKGLMAISLQNEKLKHFLNENSQNSYKKFCFKYKNKKNTVILNKENSCILKDNLLQLDDILFFEIIKIFGKEIYYFLDEKQMEKKLYSLINTFGYFLTQLGINLNDEIMQEIYAKTTNISQKMAILKQIQKITNKDLLKMTDNDELNKIKLEKIKTEENKTDYFKYLEDSNNFNYALEVLISKALFFHIKKTIELKEKTKTYENIKYYADLVSIILIKILRKYEIKEDKKEIRKLFEELLKLSENLSYEKYMTVYLCNGELENSTEFQKEKVEQNILKTFNNEEYLNNLIQHKTSIYRNINNINIMHHQLSSFSEILFIESTYEIKNSQIEFSFNFINQSMLLLSEINFYVLSDLKIKKGIEKFSLSKRSIEKKAMHFDYAESKDLILNFFVEFRYTKKSEKVEEFLNLNPLKLNFKHFLKKRKASENWSQKRWERKIAFKNISNENIKKIQNYCLEEKIETSNYAIFNGFFELKNTEIIMHCIQRKEEFNVTIRGEEKSLVDGFCDFIKGEILC